MAVYTGIRLAQVVLTTADATLYTVPASTSVIVKQIILTNTTATNATVSVSLVPSGGTAGVGNRIVEQITVPAFGVTILDINQIIPTGAFLAAKASAATTVTLTASGVTVV